MNYNGILIAVLTFLIIGLFHPIVIKAEYYFSKKIWPAFAAAGAIFIVLSLLCRSTLLGAVLGVSGASSLWSIKELFQQEKRVEKGWFPRNPRRTCKADKEKADGDIHKVK